MLLVLSFSDKPMALKQEEQHLQPQLKLICRIMNALQYLRHYNPEKFRNNFLMTFSQFLNVRNWKKFSIHQRSSSKHYIYYGDTKQTLLKRNNGKISVLVYRKPTHTNRHLHYSSHHQRTCTKSVISSLFNKVYSIITNKNDLTKENARIKQVLKENGNKQSIISKIFKRITNNHSFFQLKEQTQATII